jgi:polyisoprenoid-binding protein YceI
MKKIFFMLILLIAAITLSACSVGGANKAPNKATLNDEEEKFGEQVVALPDGQYQLNTEDSRLAWKANKVLAAHTGLVTIKSGSLAVVNGQLGASEIVMDMTTITSDEGIDPLVKHLKSADFFNVEEYPEARLVINSSTLGDQPGEYIVSGDLTIKDITKPIDFRAKANMEDNRLSAKSEIIIDRLNWDIKYRSGKFFQDLGDNLISDEISFVINLNASKIN